MLTIFHRRHRIAHAAAVTRGSGQQPTHNKQQQFSRRLGRIRSKNCANFRRYQRNLNRKRLALVRIEDEEDESELEQQLQAMQAHVQALEQQRHLLLASDMMINAQANRVAHAMDIAREFYVLFGHGYNPVLHPKQSQRAASFLRSVMTEDAVCTEFKGVDMFLKQYEVSCQAHISMKLCLHHVELLEQTHDKLQVKACASVQLRVSRDTLVRLFPAIIQDEALVQELIGKEYVMQYDKVFHFQSNGQIYQHESRIDFCSSLLQLVKDPFVTIKLLQASLMTKHGHWKIADEVQEDQYALSNAAL